MKPTHALTIKQPWAWAILHGKDIENRVWNTKFRGEFWIHTSWRMTLKDYRAARDYIEARGLRVPAVNNLQLGGIVGRATLTGVTSTAPSDLIWHMPGNYGFRLENITPVTFVPCKGKLNFWKVPQEILDQL